MIDIEITARISEYLSQLYIKWLRDKSYPHSYENYLRDLYKIEPTPYVNYIRFNCEKDYTWFLLNL